MKNESNTTEILKKKGKNKEFRLRALNEASSSLLTNSDLDEAIDNALRIIGEAVEVDRVYIFRNHFDSKSGKLLTSQTNEWCADPSKAQIDNQELQNFDMDFIPRWKKAFEQNEPVYGLVRDFPEDEKAILEPQEIKSLLAIPIYVSKKLWGFIGYDELKTERNWTNAEIDILQSTANMMVLNIQHRTAELELMNKSKELIILNNIINAIIKSHTIKEIFRNVLDLVIELLDFDGGGFYLLNEKERTAEIVYSKGIPDDEISPVKKINIDTSPYNIIFIEKKHIISENYVTTNPDMSKMKSLRSLVSIPLIADDKVIGALNIKSSKPKKLLENQINMLFTIADELSGAIKRIRISEKLTVSEANLNILFNSVEDFFFVLNSRGEILKVNNAVIQKLGYTEEELLNQDVLMVHVPARRDEAKIVVEKMLKGEEEFCSVPLISKGGEIIDVETKVNLGKWGGEEAIFGISRDVSYRKKMERELRLSDERWKYALEGNGDGVWDWNLKTNEVYFSKRWKEMLGFMDHEIKGSLEEWDLRVHPDDKKMVYEKISRHISGETPYYMSEHRVLCKNGEYKWVLDRGKVMVWDYDLKPLRMVGTHADIDQRKMMEESLKDSSSRNKALLDAIPDLIFLQTRDGMYIDFHVPEVGIKHSNMNSIVGKKMEDILPEEVCDKFYGAFESALSTNEAQVVEYELKHKREDRIIKGEFRDISEMYEARVVSYGTGDKFLTIVRNVTGRKRAELEIIKALNKEKELNEMKSNFISITSHEFRTPLATILSSMELLQYYSSGWKDEKKNIHYTRIKNSISNMTHMLNDILSLNKAESGKMMFKPEKTNLKELCESLVNELKDRASILHKIEFEYYIQDEIVFLDPKLTSQAIGNLLDNAIKYTPEGGKISLSVEESEKNLLITVTDEGIGISAADRSKIFRPFERGKNAETISGTGLGLSIVKKSAEMHSGTVDFEPHKTKGTIFKYSIPIKADRNE